MFNIFLETIERVNGFKETIGNFQWFLRQPSPLNVFLQSDHCHQWFFNGCWSCYHRFQWFSMVLYHWSNDAMVSMHRYGLIWQLCQGQQMKVSACISISTLPQISKSNSEKYIQSV